MIWPFKPKRRLDLPELEPGMLKYPFEAPVLHLGVDTATVFRAVGDDALMGPGFKADLGLCREFEGDAPLVGDRVYSADGLVRVITGAVPVARADRSPFGDSLVYARLDFSSPEPADLDKLKDQIVTLIESDPDDVWNQFVSHDELIALVRSASGFAELFDVVADQGGAGELRRD